MKIISKEIREAVPEAYLPFSAYVIQTRALPDARDCLKTGGRYILWSQYLEKNTYDKNRKKGPDVVGPVSHWNPHGDAGIWDNIVRFAKPFSMRYCLEDTKGNVGSMRLGKDHAAPRYLELRSSEIANEFTKLIKKGAVEHWKLNYSGEDKYPSVFPTLFPNFVNGNTGIGVGCASSIPCFNLSEAINSLKILVNNRDASYDEIYIAPDFPTGATIINGEAVKESLRTGRGKAVKLRAVIEYDETKNELEIQQIPYQVYTGRIAKQIEEAIAEGKLLGIKSFYDGTDRSCGKYGTKIIITLNKGTNVKQLVRQLYKETSLQSTFTICQLMLENGTKPKQYGLKEMMLAYLDHAMDCLKRSYIFDYEKVKKTLNIKEGYLVAIAHIDEVVQLIKSAESEASLVKTFEDKYGLNEEQSKAIIDLKLRSLMKLEHIKIEKEIEKLRVEAEGLDTLINDEATFKTAFIAELDRINKKWGDSRRTTVLNLDCDEDKEDAEPIEKKELLIYYTNLGNIYTIESSTLMKTRRGGKGSKIKMADNEAIVKTINDDNFSSLMIFSNLGQAYALSIDDLPINSKVNVAQLFDFKPDEKPTTITSVNRRHGIEYYVFVTKNGMIKKTAGEEYNFKRGKALKAINLKDGDEVVNVLFMKNEQVGILTNNGNFVKINTEDINAIGRATAGVKAIKLNDDDYVIDAKIIDEKDKYMITLSERGLIKKASMSEFPVCGRPIKGKKISDTRDGDKIVKFLTLNEESDIIIIVKRKNIKISTSELRELTRNATGVKAINIDEGDIASDLVRGQE